LFENTFFYFKKLQFITLLTAILRCCTHRKQQRWYDTIRYDRRD